MKYILTCFVCVIGFLSYGQGSDTSGNTNHLRYNKGVSAFGQQMIIPLDTIKSAFWNPRGSIAIKNGVPYYNNGTAFVNFSAGADQQTLSIAGHLISISNGNTINVLFADSVAFIDTAAAHWAAIQLRELLSNKATSFGVINNTLYPSVAAVNAWGNANFAPISVVGSVTSITAGSGLSGGTITTSGTISMPATGTAGTHGSGSIIPIITTDIQGRVTVLSDATNSPAWTNVTGIPTTLAGYGITDAYTKAQTNSNIHDSLNNLSGGTGISVGSNSHIITNTAPDQTVTLTSGTGISATGTYPNFTITNTSPSSGGTVTTVTVTTANGVSGTVATATTTPAITIALGAITPTSVAASGAMSGSNLSGTNTGDQTITLTGDVSGSGTGSFSTALTTTGVSAGSYTHSSITVDAKGRITSASSGTVTSGTVTSVTSADANITVATGTTTPVITMVASPLEAVTSVSNNATYYPTFVSTGGGNQALKTATTAITYNPSTGALTTASFVGTLNGNAATATLASTVTTNANLTGDVTSSGNATTLATVNTNTGNWGSATQTPTFTVNGKGLVTAAGNVTITGFTSSTLTNGNIYIGNGSNVATSVTPSGDWTISNTGTATLKTSGALAGSWTTTTQSAADNSTKIATTAYVDVPMLAIKTQTVTAASYTTSVTLTTTSTNVDSKVIYLITAQAGALLFNNPSGVWSDMQPLIVRIKDNGTARALTYGTKFRAGNTALPTTTVLSKTMFMGFYYNSADDKFDFVAYDDNH